MNARLIQTAGRYLGGWGTLIFFVVLLTFIFSFLGTIFCAVLAGMMVAATKLPRWHTCALSVVFPGVLFTMLRSQKAELLGGQVLMLALVCFAAYWLTYLAASLLVFYEAKPPAKSEVLATRKGWASKAVTPPCGPTMASVRTKRSSADSGRMCAGVLDLEALQGKWAYAGADANRSGPRKTLEIARQHVRLSAADAEGRILSQAEGYLQVWPPDRLPEPQLASLAPQPSPDTVVSI